MMQKQIYIFIIFSLDKSFRNDLKDFWSCFSVGPIRSEWSSLTCSGEGDQVLRDELGVAVVTLSEWPPQDGLQTSKESHNIQHVKGEATGEGQQVASGADRCRWRVRHHVPVNGAAERRCGRNVCSVRKPRALVHLLPQLSELTCSPECQVTVGAGDSDV